ncbi:MAG TPA: TonB-dependent receptor [Verrucomicrobiae bacterium]|nr:TonB-dependent receptor [Verrucomicrobiae bacterium]
MTTTPKFLLSALIVALLCLTPSAFAQAISGDLVGTILDATGAAIPGVTVTAMNTATNVKFTAPTNASGDYRISNLPPGTYEVSAEAKGFAKATLRGVAIELNRTTTASLKLEVGSLTTTVDVSEAGALLDTTTAQVQQTYATQDLQDLPMTTTGNGVLNLSLLQAGVASSGGMGYGTGPSVGGQRPTNNSFTVDGVNNNAKSVTGPVVSIPNDDVAEFSILANQFRAEYGHSSGGQFNTIVKSGTNTLHFTIYEYLRNRDLNAIDQSYKNAGVYSLPRYDNNRLGANIGGPILKNKLFIFGGFEYNPYGAASTSSATFYAPTASGYATLANVPGISTTNLNVAKQYAVAANTTAGAPSVTIGSVTVPTGVISAVGPNFSNTYNAVISTDYNMSEKDQLRGRYIENHYTGISTTADLPVFYTPVPNNSYLATAAWYHTFSPTLVNEFRLGFNRNNQSEPVGDQTFPGLDAFPNLFFADTNLQIGPNPNYPQSGINNAYQATNNLSWTHGAHTIKAGVQANDYISGTHFSQRVRGDYEYTSFANYLMDLFPDSYLSRTLGNPQFSGNGMAYYGFVQDTWKVNQNLTLDLGLRYEWTAIVQGARNQALDAIASVPGLVDFRSPKSSTWGGLSPRVGLAYSVGHSGDTVVRAGFGRATDVVYDNLPLNSPPPQFAVAVTPAPGSGPSNFLKNGGITAAQYAPSGTMTHAQAVAATSYYLPDQTLPYSLNWTLEVQHTYKKDYTFTARYVGTRGVHELMQMWINRLHSNVNANSYIPTYLTAPSAAQLAASTLTVGQLREPSAGWADPAWAAAGFLGPITSYQPQGWSFYNGLDLQAQRRMSKGLLFLAAYTWSRNIDNSTDTLNSSALTQRRVPDMGNLTQEKATSGLDRRNRFSLSSVYDLPFFKDSRNWFYKNIVGNWQFSPVYIYESPEYFSVSSGVNSDLNGDSGSISRTITNPAGQAGIGTAVYGLDKNGTRIAYNAATASVNTVVAWVAINPNARYIQAGVGALQNTGRNTQATRPIDNIDFTITKRFQIFEKAKLEFSAQAYNVFNHPQFIPGSVNDVGAVGTSGSTAYVTATNVNFNNPEVAFSSSARSMQIVAKFIW